MLQRLFNLGTKSGMPRYMAIVALLQIGILLLPESVFAFLGLESFGRTWQLPTFVQYYVSSSSSKHAVLAFWLLSPFTLVTNTALCIAHINSARGFEAYRNRRIKRLAERRKSSDYSLIISCVSVVALYIWAIAIRLDEPTILGNAVPTTSLFKMILINGGGIGLLLPIAISIVVTELRMKLPD